MVELQIMKTARCTYLNSKLHCQIGKGEVYSMYMAMQVCRECRYSFIYSLLRHWMEVAGQLHASAALARSHRYALNHFTTLDQNKEQGIIMLGTSAKSLLPGTVPGCFQSKKFQFYLHSFICNSGRTSCALFTCLFRQNN